MSVIKLNKVHKNGSIKPILIGAAYIVTIESNFNSTIKEEQKLSVVTIKKDLIETIFVEESINTIATLISFL